MAHAVVWDAIRTEQSSIFRIALRVGGTVQINVAHLLRCDDLVSLGINNNASSSSVFAYAISCSAIVQYLKHS